jgi:hypothetical protein
MFPIFLIFLLLLVIVLVIINGLSINKNNIFGGNYVPHNNKTRSHSKKTYKIYIDSKNFFQRDYQYLIDELNKLGWKESDNHYADFVFHNWYNKIIYNNVKSDLKYGFSGIKLLYNKNSLFKNMKTLEYLPQTEEINRFIWRGGNIIIVKEMNSYGQRGIHIIKDYDKFVAIKHKLLTNNKHAICSTYITNPLLYKGKKFHLRIFIVVVITKNTKKIMYIKNNIFMFTAKKEYIIRNEEDYLDRDMNITAGSVTSEIIMWPEFIDKPSNFDLKYLSNDKITFFNNCNQSINNAIQSISLDNLSLLNTQKAGFFIYGGDIMLDDTGHAWILELNIRPGMGGTPDGIKHISKEDKKINNIHFFKKLFRWLLDHIILPYFNHHH